VVFYRGLNYVKMISMFLTAKARKHKGEREEGKKLGDYSFEILSSDFRTPDPGLYPIIHLTFYVLYIPLTALSISLFPGAPGSFSMVNPQAFTALFNFPVMA